MPKLKKPKKDDPPKGTPPKLTKQEYGKLSNQRKEAYITAYGQGNFLKPGSKAAEERQNRNSGGKNRGKNDHRGGKNKPTPTPTPTPAPVEPEANATDPLPWDTAYASGLAGINSQRTAGLFNIDTQDQNLQHDYGFSNSASFTDDNGTSVPTGFADPSNPYARASLLQKLYNRRRSGTTNSMASRGQLYSGAIQNARNFDAGNFNQDYDRLRNDYDSRRSQFDADRAGINSQAELDASQLFAQRLRDAVKR